MNGEQKRAWFCMATMVPCVVGFLALLPFFGPSVAFAAFSFFGLNGLGGFMGPEKVDERDKSIARSATLGGAMASYMAFIAGCMGTWAAVFAFGGNEQVSVHALGTITMSGGVVFYFTRSVMILVLYRSHVEADNA